MSACLIKTYVDAILVAYSEICSNCCVAPTPCSSPADTSTLCGDGQGLLWEIRTAVLGMLATTPEGCNPLTALEPDPGELTTCLTEAYLQSLLAWLQGITCQPCPPEDCFCVRYQYRETPTSYPICDQRAELTAEYPADYYEECSYANTDLGFRLYWDTDESAWMLSFMNCLALGGTSVVLNVGETRMDPRRVLSDATGGYWVEITDCPCVEPTSECTPSVCWTIEEYYNTSDEAWQDLTVTGVAGSCTYLGADDYILAWSDDDGVWSIYHQAIKWVGDSSNKQDPRGMYTIVGENPDPTRFRNTLLCVGICEAECVEELSRCNSHQVPNSINISFSCGIGNMTWGRPDHNNWPNCIEFTAPKPYDSAIAARSGSQYATGTVFHSLDASWDLSWSAVVRLAFDRTTLACQWVCDFSAALFSHPAGYAEWEVYMYSMPLIVTSSCDPHGVISDTWVFTDAYNCQPSPISGALTIVT